MVAMYHPKLDRTVDVRARKARVLEQSGWQRTAPEADEAAFFTAAAGVDEPPAPPDPEDSNPDPEEG